MRIDRLFKLGLPTISFEFFPPKNEGGWAQLYQAIGELHSLKPSYVSVTYGAGGSTRQKTVDLVSRIQNELKIRSMAHLTCVGHTADEIGKILDDLWEEGIRNVLALRGDPPAGQTNFVPTQGGFANADALVSYIRSRPPGEGEQGGQGGQDFCTGVAGYPEGHPQCLNLIRDMEHLKRKVDNGANFIVTQLFFDNADFYRFRDQARSMGIKVPIVAGIMPIGNVGQIKRFVSMCGSKIPQPLLVKLESLEADPEAVYSAGVDYATQQCRDLLDNGCEGIHFYTLNRSKATVQIVKALKPKHAA
jgi:methylenetetrahydrofolate reductase (NADPH)